ncbi:MAG TPA: hypothetical protein VLZ89_13160 [Anaerolineales bacterium]|nr:hypothetical protein [Anaerolineales bacterium]
MNRFRSLIKSELFAAVFLLVAVSAIAYLPFIAHFSYFNDDWYEMFATGTRGPMVFMDIFSVDRPARAFLMIPLYILFGRNPFPYNVSAYLFRLFSGLSVLWSLRMVWPQQKRMATLAALFYLVYPGFLSQPNAIDFQSHIAGLCFATFSIALTLKAVRSGNLRTRILLSGLSIFFGLAYLSQMEYYAGYEVVRFVLLFLLAGQSENTFFARLKRAGLWYLPFLVAPLIFFTWRLFFFQDVRKQTDVSLQLGSLIAAPRHTLLVWSATLIQNMVDVTVLAWIVPFASAFSNLPPVNVYLSLGAALIAVLIAWVALRRISPNSARAGGWGWENLCAGLVIVAGGLAPIIAANRGVDFGDFSRYSVISMFGAAMVLAVFVDRLENFGFQLGFILLLTGLAVITHFANGAAYARLADANDAFWWQVSWRIPQIKKGTTLVVHYPFGQAGEDYTIWSPANLIYYPDSQSQKFIQPAIYAALLNHDAVDKVLTHKGVEYDTRRGSIHTFRNYSDILVITQPSSYSCIHLIDGNQTEFASSEDERVMLMAPYSQIQDVVPGPGFQTPPQVPFGPEPMQGWCYYYEKASYARQVGDWQSVLNLGDQADRLRLAPQDLIEWMPFLQGYAHFGNQTRLTQLARLVDSDPFVAAEACRILTGMQLDPASAGLVKSLYCISK